MAVQPPAFLTPYIPTLWQLNPLISAGLQSVLQYIGVLNHASTPQPDHWRHIEVRYQLQGNALSRDIYATTFDVVKYHNGAIDSNWTAADYTAVETPLSTCVHNLLGQMAQTCQLIESRYYDRLFNDLSDTKPFPPTGPPQLVNTYGQVSASGAHLQAPQVALSTTDRTPYRMHWGRNYWPLPQSGLVDNTGHWLAATCDTFATQIGAMYDAWQAANFFPVVVVTQIQRAPARGLLTVTELQVDNVPDVIRRRRPSSTTYRAHHP